MSFNLVDQPWIPVVTQDFQIQDVSLIQLFQTWETLREIQADNPPTTLAIYRLLLAVLHRAYNGPRNADHWEEIFEDSGQGAIAYLKTQRDRFDLLHPDYPFMQDLVLPVEKAVPIYALHTMSTSQVFSHEHEWSGYSISLPQAARLLVRLQGCDITSLRAFYVGQSSGNRSAVNTPTINAANVLVRGSTLKQTLMFNLMRYDPASEMPSAVTGEDVPAWETSYAGKPKKTSPQGYISYLSFPWRRLRLFPEADQVSQLAITMGNSLPDKVSPQIWECGVAYREDKPVRLSLTKQLWRNADTFLLTADKQRRPQIVDWLAELKRDDLVEDVVTFQISGLSADKAKPLGWSWEQFSVPIQYVTDADLSQTLKIAIAVAEEHQQIFRSFRGSPYFALAEVLKYGEAGNLASALDGESRYWATLERKFPELLDALPQDSQTGADGITRYGGKELPAWTQTVQTAARNAFTESIASIRNYQARAAALRTLERKLADLRASPEEKEAQKAKAAAKKKQAVVGA
jgi:CRISPR system Cascade subunit CasA